MKSGSSFYSRLLEIFEQSIWLNFPFESVLKCWVHPWKKANKFVARETNNKYNTTTKTSLYLSFPVSQLSLILKIIVLCFLICSCVQEKGFFLPEISQSKLKRLYLGSTTTFFNFLLYSFVWVILQIEDAIKKLNRQRTNSVGNNLISRWLRWLFGGLFSTPTIWTFLSLT